MRDASRYANEVQIPGVSRTANLGGNTNASSTAIQQGIVQRGLAEKAADVSSSLRGDAWNQAVQLAEQGRQFDTSSILDALKSTGTLGANAAASGIAGTGSAIEQQRSLYDLANTGASGIQSANQAAIDDAKAQSEYSADRLNSLLQQYYAAIQGDYGGTSTGTSTSQVKENKSIGDTISGVLGGLGGLFKGFK
jgi:hypothetical protein